MTLISAIILDAYRESNTVQGGATLTSTQLNEGLSRLSSLVAGVYGYGAGEELLDWPVGQVKAVNPISGWSQTDWANPLPNSRLMLDHAEAQTIYLPSMPSDGARIGVVDVYDRLSTLNVTLVANGRTIEGASTTVLNTDGLKATWFYSAPTGNWQRVDTLVETDPMPFPEEFDDYFIIKLAARLNPRYGRSLGDLSLARLSEVQEQLSARYRQTRDMPVPLALQNLRGPREYIHREGRGGRFGFMR